MGTPHHQRHQATRMLFSRWPVALWCELEIGVENMALNTVAAGRAWLYVDNIGCMAGTGTGQGFSMPVSVAPAKNGILYVANRHGERASAPRISKVTLDAEFIAEFGRVEYDPYQKPGKHPEDFIWLADIALDQDENVYAADEWRNRISVFDKDGTRLQDWGEAGEGEGQLNGPCSFAFDPEDNLLILNGHNSRVQKFTKDGRYISGFGKKGSGEGELDLPWGITVDNQGDIYVADWNNHRVQKFSPDGAYLMSFGDGSPGNGSLNHPAGVAVDRDGDVYVADWMNHRVVIYTADGNLLAYLRGDVQELSKWAQLRLDIDPDMVKAQRRTQNLDDLRWFALPVNVVFDQELNNLIVCDTQRYRLQIYHKDKEYQDPIFNL